MNEYPLLRELIGIHLHQDYDLFAPDPIGAFLVGVREDFSPSRLPELLEELGRLEGHLRQLNPDQGQRMLDSLGSEVIVAADGSTPASWTAKLTEEVRKLEPRPGPATG